MIWTLYWIGVFVALCAAGIVCLVIARLEEELTLKNVLIGIIASFGSWLIVATILLTALVVFIDISEDIIVWKKKEP